MRQPVAPRLRSRAAALAILSALIALVIVVVVMPIWSAWTGQSDDIDHSAEMVARLRASAADAPALEAALKKLGEAQRDRSAILIAPNANLASVSLQAELKRITDAHGAQLRSVQQLPAIQEGDLSRIGIRADFQGDTTQTTDILYDIQAHSPVLLVHPPVDSR